MNSPAELRDLFQLDPGIVFLNHGSFGACPRPVFEVYQAWQRELERQPVAFLQRRLKDELRKARGRLASYLGTESDNLVYVDNATWGVNVVARSLQFGAGDEVLATNHEYGACSMTWEWLLGKVGATLVRQCVPAHAESAEAWVDTFWKGVTPQTKAIFLSHVTAPTAIIFPVAEVCRRAREAGIITVIDGAHAPGQVPIDLEAIGADFYSGNLHKWLCAPKGAGFLYVRPERQARTESLVISWGWGADGEIVETSFVERNEWQGTRDYSSFLSVPAAIDFGIVHDWHDVRARCHNQAAMVASLISELTRLPRLSEGHNDWFAQMVSCPIRTDDPLELKRRLWDEFKVEVPISTWQGNQFVRVSFQGYNSDADADVLLRALEQCL